MLNASQMLELKYAALQMLRSEVWGGCYSELSNPQELYFEAREDAFVFYNSSSGNLELHYSLDPEMEYRVGVFDQFGRKVKASENLNPENTLQTYQMDKLPSAFYSVVIRSKEKVILLKRFFKG